MANRIAHFEITGRDGKALQRFYGDLFGWRINADNPMDYGTIDPEQTGIGGGIATGPEGYPGHVTVYVEVPDVEAALARAEELGGARMMGPEDVMPGLRIGLFTDPEGHVFGVLTNTAGAGG